MTHAPRPPGPPFAIAGAGTPHAPIVFEHVSKRYQLSVAHDSLRDAIPALIKRLIRKNGRGELHEGEFWALKDVSFHVKQGETLGIIGHNGAGKSTILKLLSRITKQTKGSIALRGRLAALIELGGGFHSDLNGAENIYLQGTMLGLTHREVRNLFDSIVAFSELEQFLQTPVKRYSSGMIVKLGFAIAAHVHPDVLLLDEVLAVGDIAFQQKCFKRIDQLRDSGTTMIFISHNLEAVNKLCDRVLLLRQGEVIEEGTPGRIIKRFRDEMFSHALKVAAQTPAVKSSAAVQITQVNLTDPAGFPVDSVNTTEPLRVEIHYQANRPVFEPNFRIAIERLDGLLCHGSLSRQNGLALKALEAEGKVSVEYPALNLLPNLYQITIELFEAGNPLPVAALRHRCFFQVTADGPQEHGAVHLEHVWRLNQEHNPGDKDARALDEATAPR